MVLRRLDPFMTMNQLRREIGQLLDGFDSGWQRGGLATRGQFPAVNIWEDVDSLHAEAEVPGVKQEDIEILTEGNELTIRGRRETVRQDDVSFHRRERAAGEFIRVVTLPVEIDTEKVEASLKEGVLTLRMPKAETAKPRKISVSAE